MMMGWKCNVLSTRGANDNGHEWFLITQRGMKMALLDNSPQILAWGHFSCLEVSDGGLASWIFLICQKFCLDPEPLIDQVSCYCSPRPIKNEWQMRDQYSQGLRWNHQLHARLADCTRRSYLIRKPCQNFFPVVESFCGVLMLKLIFPDCQKFWPNADAFVHKKMALATCAYWFVFSLIKTSSS